MNSKLFKMIPIASCHVVKMALSVVLTFVLKYLTNYLYETPPKKYLRPILPWAKLFTKQVFGSNLKPINWCQSTPGIRGFRKEDRQSVTTYEYPWIWKAIYGSALHNGGLTTY